MSFSNSRKLKLNRVTFIAFRELAKACKDGKLAEEELPTWTKKTLSRIWKQVWEDHESTQWPHEQYHVEQKTDFLRHLIGETEEKGMIA